MEIELSWWMVPFALVLIGWLVANRYQRRNYNPYCYGGDFVTGFISLAIFLAFVIAAVAFAVGLTI